MDLGIHGKRAVVIGGSSGLGKAAAEALAKEGVDLVLFARSQERLARTQQELRAKCGVQIDTVIGDITQAGDVNALADMLAAGADWIS